MIPAGFFARNGAEIVYCSWDRMLRHSFDKSMQKVYRNKRWTDSAGKNLTGKGPDHKNRIPAWPVFPYLLTGIR